VKSTKEEGWTSLAEVKSRMQEGQKGLYYIMGGSASVLRTSPLLEIYRKKDIEVIILDDNMDEIVFSGIDKYGDIDLKAVNKTSAGEDLKDDSAPDKTEELKPLIEKIKTALGASVKDVRASVRLADSPSCIVLDEDEPSIKMQQMLRSMGPRQIPDIKPVLEINPGHEIVKRLEGATDDAIIDDTSWLLLEQAMLIEGLTLDDPGRFVQRLNRVLSRAV
jgi:molecular chaperone HtpG